MQMNQPKISIIVPVYNTQKYLHECMNSLVNQTLEEIEIICVDDGSTDGSLDILREYEMRDSRVKVLTSSRTNAGAARNLGIKYALGEYLAFLDSDDFFELTAMEQMYRCAKERNADIVVCEMKRLIEESGKYVYVNWHIRRDLLPDPKVFSFADIEKNAFRSIMSYVWDRLIKRSLVLANQISFQSQPLYNDTIFSYETMMEAESITVLDEALVCHRIRSTGDSITDKRFLNVDCAYSVLNELKEYLTRKGMFDRYEKDFCCFAIHLLNHTFSSNIVGTELENEIRDKIYLWMNEFNLNGHRISFYYELSEYRRLFRKVIIPQKFTGMNSIKNWLFYICIGCICLIKRICRKFGMVGRLKCQKLV